MTTLNTTIATVTQRTSDMGTMNTPVDRAAFSRSVTADITNIVRQLNEVHKVLGGTLISESGLEALDKGLSGNVIKTHIDATAASAVAYWSPVKGRANTIKETVDVLLSELSRLENLISTIEDISEFDPSALLSSIAENALDLIQLASDTMGPDYVLNGDGVPVLTYSISQAVDAIGALFTGYVATGNTYDNSFPALTWNISLSEINIDTTLAQSVITNLPADLTAIRAFTGMTNASDNSPTYSAYGTTYYLGDGTSLEEALFDLDNQIFTVASSIPALQDLENVLSVGNATGGNDIDLNNADALTFGTTRVERFGDVVYVYGAGGWAFDNDLDVHWGNMVVGARAFYESLNERFILETLPLVADGWDGENDSILIKTGNRTVTDAAIYLGGSGGIQILTGDASSSGASASPYSGTITIRTGNVSTPGLSYGGYSGGLTVESGTSAHNYSGSAYFGSGDSSGASAYSGSANFRSGNSWAGATGAVNISTGYAANGASGDIYISTGYGTGGYGGISLTAGAMTEQVRQSTQSYRLRVDYPSVTRNIWNLNSSGANRLLTFGDETFTQNEQINEVDFGRYTQQSNEGRGFLNPNRLTLREDWMRTPQLVANWGNPWANVHWSIYGTNATNSGAVQCPGGMALIVSGSKVGGDSIIFAPSTRDPDILTSTDTSVGLFFPELGTLYGGYTDALATLNPWIPSTGAISLFNSTSKPSFRTSIRTSNSLANLTIEMGFRRRINSFDNLDDNNKMIVKSVAGGNWFLVTSDNGNDTVTDLGIAPSTNTWYTIEMITDDSRYVHCFINKVQRNSSTSNRLRSTLSYLGIPYIGAKMSAGAVTTRYFIVGPIEATGELPTGAFS